MCSTALRSHRKCCMQLKNEYRKIDSYIDGPNFFLNFYFVWLLGTKIYPSAFDGNFIALLATNSLIYFRMHYTSCPLKIIDNMKLNFSIQFAQRRHRDGEWIRTVTMDASIVIIIAVAIYMLKHQFGLSKLIEKSHQSSIYLRNVRLFAVHFLNNLNGRV